MGPLGGQFEATGGSNLLRITRIDADTPAAQAGLQVGDFIFGAFGKEFAPLPSATNAGWLGSVQDFGEAIEYAES